MQTYIEAPKEEKIISPSLFLAGGISGCPNWQSDAIGSLGQALTGFDHTVVNPRRANFDISDKSASRVQIDWEYRYLRSSDVVLFWFPSETLCPIALFELGSMAVTRKPLVVGCHPDYQRLEDVRIQLEMERPEIQVHTSLGNVILEAAQKLASGRF